MQAAGTTMFTARSDLLVYCDGVHSQFKALTWRNVTSCLFSTIGQKEKYCCYIINYLEIY
jgi:hypothetical protein